METKCSRWTEGAIFYRAAIPPNSAMAALRAMGTRPLAMRGAAALASGEGAGVPVPLAVAAVPEAEPDVGVVAVGDGAGMETLAGVAKWVNQYAIGALRFVGPDTYFLKCERRIR